MPIIYRPGVTTYVTYVKLICRFVTRHQGSLRPALDAVLSDTQMATYDAAVAAILAMCAVFDAVYPNIKA